MYEFDDAFGTNNDYPWSTQLEKELKLRLGDDYGILLALLWENTAGDDLAANVRYLYMDTVTRQVRKNFSEQIGTWCRERGVKYIGHIIEDDNRHTRTGGSLGHFFRGLAGQDMAGIDDIGGQVFPQGEDINYNDEIIADTAVIYHAEGDWTGEHILNNKNIPELSISPSDDRIRYIHKDGSQIWMFVNEGVKVYNGTVRFKKQESGKKFEFYQYDAWENRILPADIEKSTLKLRIEPLKSCIYICEQENLQIQQPISKKSNISKRN